MAACARLRVQASWDVETATTAATLRSLARRIRELTPRPPTTAKPSWSWCGPGGREGAPPPKGSTFEFPPSFPLSPTLLFPPPPPLVPRWPLPHRCRLRDAGRRRPHPASSGQTVRVRRNRSGDHQLNQARYTLVLTRLRTDPATRVYATRRRAQGKTNREITRCLVRYVARQLYRLLEAAPAIATTQKRHRNDIRPSKARFAGL